MILRFHTAAAALSLIALSASADAQGIDYSKISIITTQLAPSVYVLTGSPNVDPGHPEGAGGRIGVLVGSEGVLMVDAQYAPLGDKVLTAIRKLSNAPIKFLIDTHEHPDHTGGNPTFAKLGATIFAREETREELAVVPPPPVVKAIGDAANFTDPERLPSVTYGLGSSVKIYLDGETVDLIPVAASHTDGDTIVRFEEADVMMIGDFYRNYGYPFVDPSHGGTIKGVLSAIDQTLTLAGPNTILAPGHGSLVTRDRLGGYRKMIADMIDKVQAQINAGKTLKQVLAAKLTAPYDASVPGGLDVLPAGLGTSADRFVGEIFAELSGQRG